MEPKAPAAGSAPRVVGATVAGCQCELLPGHAPLVEDLRSMMSSLEAKRVLSVGEGGEGSTTATLLVAGGPWYDRHKVVNVQCHCQHDQCWRTSSHFLLCASSGPFGPQSLDKQGGSDGCTSVCSCT